MISRWTCWLVGMVVITACVGTQRKQVGEKSGASPDKSVDTVELRIHAVDLSEDMSSLSSQNDEISLFGFVVNDSLKQVSLLFVKSFTMTNQKNTQNVVVRNFSELSKWSISLVMIERDSDHTENELERMIRGSYFELIGHYKQHGNFGIEKYIEDNDVMGVRRIAPVYNGMAQEFEFSGYFKLDRYRYKLSFMAR